MPPQLVILPVIIPLLAGIVNMLVHRPRRTQRQVDIAALTLNVVVAAVLLASVYNGPGNAPDVLTSQMGNWPAPFGVSVVVDVFAATLLLVTACVFLGVYVFGLTQMPPRFSGGYFYTLVPMLLVGVNWAFIAGDVFNLFVSFEIMLLASYSLLTSGTTPRQMRHAYKYILLNLIVSAVFVAACGWVYGTTGTLNFAELAVLAQTDQIDRAASMAIAGLAFVFFTTAAAFPLWFWLPEVYPTLPPTLGGLYAGLLTKVGVYALVRLLCMCMGGSDLVLDVLTPLVLISACGTMFLGVLGAVGSSTIRRILSIHVISQVGYMIFGIGLCMAALRAGGEMQLARLAIAATLLYMVQHMIVKCALFLCCGMIEKYAGTDDLGAMGAILQRDKWLATLFLVAALSLVGLPPLSGFFGKFLLIRGGFELGGGAGITLSIFALMTGALTLLSMAKIWSYGFWSPPPAASRTATLPLDYRPPHRRKGLLAVSSLVVLALSVGLGAQWYFNVASAAAESIVDPTAYVRAVLGENAANLMPDLTMDEGLSESGAG